MATNQGELYMRSMSMLQLAGGVVAAGVVAAGTTAFTASGVTNNIPGGSLNNGVIFLGGTVSQTVDGAELTAMTLNGTAGAITDIDITLAGLSGTDLTGKVPTLAITATGGTHAGSIVCAVTTPGTDWNCAPTSGTYTGITAVAVTVA
jgi:hypothetical protein